MYNETRTGYTRSSNGTNTWSNGSIRIGKYRIKTNYLYVGAGVLGLILLLALSSVIMGALAGSLVMHFGVVAGVILLLANVREMIGKAHAQRNGTALLNTLVGGSLVAAWIAQALPLFWLPAVLMLAVAAPLAVGRSGVYLTYVQTARNVSDRVRRAAEQRNG
jgi:hypothetical protein